MARFSNIKIRWETRMCTVDGDPGYFHEVDLDDLSDWME